MVEHLKNAGYEVMVFDISSELTTATSLEIKAIAAKNISEIGSYADIVITSLPNVSIVNEVVFGDEGLSSAMSSGNLLIDMSSCDPIKTQEIGNRLAVSDIDMIDAPISGGVNGAKSATLAIIVGGSDTDAKRAKPILDILGSNVFHTGDLGCGQAMKALNNLCSATGLLIVAESLKAGKTFGLKPEMIVDVLNASSGRNNSTENKVKQFIISNEYEKAGFAMDLMVKDITTAISFAEKINISMPLGNKSVDLWSEALSSLQGSPDHTEIARWVDVTKQHNT